MQNFRDYIRKKKIVKLNGSTRDAATERRNIKDGIEDYYRME